MSDHREVRAKETLGRDSGADAYSMWVTHFCSGKIGLAIADENGDSDGFLMTKRDACILAFALVRSVSISIREKVFHF